MKAVSSPIMLQNQPLAFARSASAPSNQQQWTHTSRLKGVNPAYLGQNHAQFSSRNHLPLSHPSYSRRASISLSAVANPHSDNNPNQSEKQRKIGHPFKRALPKGSLIIPPKDQSTLSIKGQPNAIILLPGTDIAPSQYQSLAESIQNASKQSTWIAVPNFPFKTANPASAQLLVHQALNALQEAGYKGEKAALAGHSLAGIFLPYAVSEKADQNPISSLILLGSYTLRDQRDTESAANRLPTLTLSGDLDGLIRVGRIAEDFHHHIAKKSDPEGAKLQKAVVLVEGMNHMQFATGRVPPTVRARDLKPEISGEQARAEVASTVVDFLEAHNSNNQTAAEALIKRVNRTEAYINPMLNAMHLDGNYHLQSPCHLADEGEECTLGSKWSEMAQSGLAHVDSAKLDVTDEFHQTWVINFFSEPHFYHPHIEPNSDGQAGKGRPLKVSTVTEAVYERADMADNALCSNMPKELRIKFNSRQAILKGLGKDIPFEESEIPNICSKINARTIEYTLSTAPKKVQERYQERGEKLVVDKDVEHNNGPSWIWSYLEYNKEVDSEGRPQRALVSHTMKTALDHPIPASGGKHYCKLIPPSKVLDWAYTDSLREQG